MIGRQIVGSIAARTVASVQFVGIVLALILLVLMTGCNHTGPQPLPPAPEAVQVLVPIAKPCKVEKVAKTPLVTEQQPVGNDLYEAVKKVLADRAILKADREKLAAANDNPCPEHPAQ